MKRRRHALRLQLLLSLIYNFASTHGFGVSQRRKRFSSSPWRIRRNHPQVLYGAAHNHHHVDAALNFVDTLLQDEQDWGLGTDTQILDRIDSQHASDVVMAQQSELVMEAIPLTAPYLDVGRRQSLLCP